MLNILLMIILIIILFIIILLYIGVKITLIYEKKGRNINGCLKILILKKIKVYSSTFPSSNEDEKEEDDEEESEKRDKEKIKRIFKLAEPCFDYFKIFLNDFLNSISVSKMDNRLTLGLDSYADTGKYIGMIWAIFAMVTSVHPKARLIAIPSFSESVIDAEGDNQIEINILKLIIPTIKLISKKEVRTLIKGVRNER